MLANGYNQICSKINPGIIFAWKILSGDALAKMCTKGRVEKMSEQKVSYSNGTEQQKQHNVIICISSFFLVKSCNIYVQLFLHTIMN